MCNMGDWLPGRLGWGDPQVQIIATATVQALLSVC